MRNGVFDNYREMSIFSHVKTKPNHEKTFTFYCHNLPDKLSIE